ncbi:hypothetical protein Taro_027377 [Colocasia esculenta]|uniref:Uncharacterized protein n=1 Tax=Colocasia esculenta TaxID=4460 RepID=A0A843V8J5_COLES|nr:hypothetical protein [Colocasia esculenta]
MLGVSSTKGRYQKMRFPPARDRLQRKPKGHRGVESIGAASSCCFKKVGEVTGGEEVPSRALPKFCAPSHKDHQELLIMEKTKRSLILKTWERCRSIGRGSRRSPMSAGVVPTLPKTKSWPRSSEKHRVAPEGCLCVCVGAEKEKFVIKMEYVNHPLFKMLLDEAEMEYGYTNDGPLELPCEVDLFQGLLKEIDQDEIARRPGCNFARVHGAYQLLSPARTPMVYRVQQC